MDFPDTLSPFVYYPSLPAGLLDYILCPHRVDKFLLVIQHLHVHGMSNRMLLTSSSLFLQQSPTCLVHKSRGRQITFLCFKVFLYFLNPSPIEDILCINRILQECKLRKTKTLIRNNGFKKKVSLKWQQNHAHRIYKF